MLPRMVLNYCMTFTAAAGKAAIPIAVSIIGTIVLFILARAAMALYRSEDLIVAVKKLQDLDPRSVRLIVSMENRRKSIKEFHSLYLARKGKNGFEAVSVLVRLPLVRIGGDSFVRRDESGDYYLRVKPNSKFEVVLEYELPEAMDVVYLLATDEKGRRLSARLLLSQTGTQTLDFRREKR